MTLNTCIQIVKYKFSKKVAKCFFFNSKQKSNLSLVIGISNYIEMNSYLIMLSRKREIYLQIQ